jgi:DNA adenine methylase
MTPPQPRGDGADGKNPFYPFLKWAGGKRWLARYAVSLAPPTFRNYFEPFLGAGAMYGALRPRKAILADCNGELINCFLAMRDNWQPLLKVMEHHQRHHSDSYYYDIRATSPVDTVERAGRFLYLNRTCFNGIYRVNQRGEFNVPRGTKNSVLFEFDNFEGASNLLSTAEIYQADFSSVINRAAAGDFIFCDPPYTVAHNNNGFVRYNEKMFSWADQIRLRDCLLQAHARGAYFLMTNAAHYSLRDIYRDDDIFISPVSRASVIGGGADYRGRYSELFISNYAPGLFG